MNHYFCNADVSQEGTCCTENPGKVKHMVNYTCSARDWPADIDKQPLGARVRLDELSNIGTGRGFDAITSKAGSEH
jgi:hypothetical protein